jgi:hypothetical protein
MTNKNLRTGKNLGPESMVGSVYSHRERSNETKRHVDLANGLAAGATAAGILLATSAAILEMPLMMGIAVGMAGIAAVAAVKKLRIIEPFLRAEEKQRTILSAKNKDESPEHMVAR